MVNSDRLYRLFCDLCRINAPALAERECVDFVAKLLVGMGLEVREDDAGSKIGGNAGNLIAKLPANTSGRPSIFLSAHFDTVEPTEGLVIEDTGSEFRSGADTILGADNKGGMAPAIEAVQTIIEHNLPHGDVYLLFSVSEETGLKGAAALDLEDLNLDYGYVLDTGPPVGSFVTRTGTHDQIDVRVVGRPAHSGKDPEKGISAIQVASDAIHGMRLGRVDEELTANFGLISGGSAVNVVCAEVRLRGEARGTDEVALERQIDHMIQRFEEAARNRGAEVHINHRRHYSGYSISVEEQVVRNAIRASKALGMESALRTTLGGSDANVFNAKGLPSIVVATGMQKVHTHEEFITKKDLVDTARLAIELVVG